MPTLRTPIGRPPRGGHITPEVIALFKQVRELEDSSDVGLWESEGGARRQWLDLRGALHTALGRKPWDHVVFDCADPIPHPTIKPDSDYKAAHQLYLELERLAGTPKRDLEKEI